MSNDRVNILLELDKRSSRQQTCKRNIYRSILPSKSFVRTKFSGIRLHKFTHDGQYLLGFMRHDKGVEIHKYMGSENFSSHEKMFDEIFHHKCSVMVATSVYRFLIRHLMHVTWDSKHVIVCSLSGQIQNVPPSNMYQTNESMTTTNALHDYTFYCIDMNGKCTGTYDMR